MAIIEDPRSGKTATVDDENRLATFAITQVEDKHTNVEGEYNSLYFQVDPTGANDYFFYLKNTGVDDVTVTDIRISTDAATSVELHVVTGTASAGTDTQITNRNLGSSKVPDVVSQYDANFTGLTSAGVLLYDEMATVNEMHHMKTSSTIIIPQGQAVALSRVAASGAITCLVSLTKASS